MDYKEGILVGYRYYDTKNVPVLFPLLNIKGKVKRAAPTEIVHLELKKMYQDFNYEMEDNSWVVVLQNVKC